MRKVADADLQLQVGFQRPSHRQDRIGAVVPHPDRQSISLVPNIDHHPTNVCTRLVEAFADHQQRQLDPVSIERCSALAFLQRNSPTSTIAVSSVFPRQLKTSFEKTVIAASRQTTRSTHVIEKRPEVFRSVKASHRLQIIEPRFLTVGVVEPQGPSARNEQRFKPFTCLQ